MRRWRRAVVVLALALALLGACLYALEMTGGYALGCFPTRIRATFVDADTLEPLPDVSVLTLPIPDLAEDAAFVAKERQRHMEEPEHWRLGLTARGFSADDGSIDLRLDATWCQRAGPITQMLGLYGPPPYHRVRALLTEREGYGRQVIDCTRGTWTEHEWSGGGSLHATIDLGEVRLKRVP